MLKNIWESLCGGSLSRRFTVHVKELKALQNPAAKKIGLVCLVQPFLNLSTVVGQMMPP